jgi:hypothetical protein
MVINLSGSTILFLVLDKNGATAAKPKALRVQQSAGQNYR